MKKTGINKATFTERPDEDFYRLLFESHPNPMWFYDLETLRFLDVNEAAVKHYGYTREEFLSLTIADIRPPEDLPALTIAIARAHEGLRSYDSVWRHRKRDGTIIYVQITGHTLTFANRPAGFVLAQDVTPQQLMQEQLRESEERFQLAARATNDAIYDFNLLTDELWWNEGVRTLFGYREDEIGTDIGWWEAQVHPEDRERVNASLYSAINGGATSWSNEYRFRRADGEYAYVFDRGYIVHDESDTPVRMIGAVVDLTKRRRAEQELQQREEHFRALIENSTDFVNVLSADGKIIYENPSSERQLGYAPNEVIGHSAFDLIHPDDVLQLRAVFSHVTAHQGAAALVRFRFRHKNGSWRHFESTATNLLDNPAVAGVVVNSRDVTERERIAAERDVERRVLDALVDQLPVGVMLRDSQGRYTQVNQQAAMIFGIERERIIGMSTDDLLRVLQARTLEGVPLRSSDDLPSAVAIREGQSVGPFEYIVTAPDGGVRHVVATATPVKVGAELFGTVIVGNDVTEQRRVQEQLRQSQKMEAIGRLAGGVAHDFNNLLTAITGYSDMLLRRTDISAAARSHVEQIRRAADRAAALTQQLLAFSRKQMLQTRVINLNKTISELEGILRRLIGEGIQLETDFAPDLDCIQADPHQMEQVVINLAVNARDAMPGGGRLVIETRNAGIQPEAEERRHGIEPNRYCLLTVRDTGHGMSEETRSRIFEPFFTTKEIGKGTGLGLSTVYGIIKQSSGHILVESEEGRGTIFKVYLPCVKGEPEATQKQLANRAESAQGTETVLLVEDEEMVRRMASEVLRLQGYTVIEAEDGRHALEICREQNRHIDLMITDVAMPEMSGAQLVHAAHLLRPSLRVLYMSGYTEEAIVQQGIVAADVAFIHKPWTPAAFLAKVREVLEASTLR